MATELVDAINGIGKAFEEFKSVNDARVEEIEKGHQARAKELSATLDKINDELTKSIKNKEILEKRHATLQERLEILEAVNDRPRATVQDKLRAEHKDLALRWIRSGGTDVEALNQYRELQKKAMEVKEVSIGSSPGGGMALPEEIATAVDKLLLKTSPIVQFVKNVRAGSSDYKELVSVNVAGYAWSSETGGRSDSATPLLRERAPTWGELYAYPKATNWSMQDIFFNVEQWLIDSIAEGMSVGLSAAIWNGDGSNKPTGMINTAPSLLETYASPERAHAALQYIPISSPSSPQATLGITPNTVIDLVYKLNARYRGNARFAANTVTQGHIRKFKDTAGQYLWQPSLQVGQPDRLLGYELFTWEQMGNPTAANAFPLAFGDFNKAYTLVTRSELEVMRESITTPGYTKFYVNRRYGGTVTNHDAVKLAKVED